MRRSICSLYISIKLVVNLSFPFREIESFEVLIWQNLKAIP